MILREANAYDKINLVMFWRSMHNQLPNYKDFPESPKAIVDSLDQIMDDDEYLVLVLSDRGIIKGCLIGYVQQVWFSEAWVAYEQAFAIHESCRTYDNFCSFVEVFEVWATQSGASVVHIGNTCGVKDLTKLYSRVGYTLTGSYYSRRFPDGESKENNQGSKEGSAWNEGST